MSWAFRLGMIEHKPREERSRLYPLVGPQELDLTREGEFRQFPPRLPGEPIFYPVFSEEYATQIARSWNVEMAQLLAT